jgi:hypothetical protein
MSGHSENSANPGFENIVAMLSPLLVKLNKAATKSQVSSTISSIGVKALWTSIHEAANTDHEVLTDAAVTGANLLTASGWNSAKIASYVTPDVLARNPNTLNDILSLPAYTDYGDAANHNHNYQVNGNMVFAGLDDFLTKWTLANPCAAVTAVPAVAGSGTFGQVGYVAPVAEVVGVTAGDYATPSAGSVNWASSANWGKLDNSKLGPLDSAKLWRVFQRRTHAASDNAFTAGFKTTADATTTMATAPSNDKTVITDILSTTTTTDGYKQMAALTMFMDTASDSSIVALKNAGVSKNHVLLKLPEYLADVSSVYGMTIAEVNTLIGDQATAATSHVTGLVTNNDITNTVSLKAVLFTVLKKMGFSAADVFEKLKSAILTLDGTNPKNAKDFNAIFDGYLVNNFNLTDRLRGYSSSKGPVAPVSTFLVGTDDIKTLVNELLRGDGTSYSKLTPVVATKGNDYMYPSISNLTILKAIQTIIGFDGSANKNSSNFGARDLSYADAFGVPEFLSVLAASSYISSTGEVKPKGLASPFNNLAPASTAVTADIYNKLVDLLSVDNSTVLATKHFAESAARAAGTGTTAATDENAGKYIAKNLLPWAAKQRVPLDDIFNYKSTIKAFNDKSPIEVSLLNLKEQPVIVEALLRYVDSSSVNFKKVLDMFTGLADADKSEAITALVNSRVQPMRVIPLFGETQKEQLASIHNAMIADTNPAAYVTYGPYLRMFKNDDVKAEFVQNLTDNKNVRVLGPSTSSLPTDLKATAAAATAADNWFKYYNNGVDDVKFLKDCGATPSQLISHLSAIKLYNSKSGLISTGSDTFQKPHWNFVDIVTAYELSEDEMENAMNLAGVLLSSH